MTQEENVPAEPLRDVLGELTPEILEWAILEVAREFRGVMKAKERPSDIVQSTLREILTDASGIEYRGRPQLRRLVKQAVARKIIDRGRYFHAERRRVDREASQQRGDDPIDVGDERLDPTRCLEGKEALEALLLRIEGLTERERHVLTLWQAGKSHRDIAHEVGISEANSMRILSDLRKKLM